MREIRPSGSEGGVRSIPHPYPYRGQRQDSRPKKLTVSDADLALEFRP